ncbi:MAG: VOC family protein [SAR202 cluster bacterium]|nr:VOC family protein [SAR202 cluster bacterium]|tara:strand:- start:167 stop:532 length:366 start_codon:yes stop_codon:yes gene_type:complete
MAIKLNHTIVPATDKLRSATFFADIFGLTFDGEQGHFAPIKVNRDLTLDFDNRDKFEPHHYAFHVSEREFEAIFQRIKDHGLLYGSEPFAQENMAINRRNGGRGVYFCDPDGHVLELLTRG